MKCLVSTNLVLLFLLRSFIITTSSRDERIYIPQYNDHPSDSQSQDHMMDLTHRTQSHKSVSDRHQSTDRSRYSSSQTPHSNAYSLSKKDRKHRKATKKKRDEWPTPEPTAWPTPEPISKAWRKKKNKWPTPKPTQWPTPEPIAKSWNKKNKKKKKKWPTPKPSKWPTPEPTSWPTPEPTEWPTPEPTEWPTSKPTNSPIRDSCEIREDARFDFIVLYDNTCGLTEDDCDNLLEGAGEIISKLLDYPSSRVQTMQIESNGKPTLIVGFDEDLLQRKPLEYVLSVRRNGECTDGGKGDTNLRGAVRYAISELDTDDDRIDKIVIISACSEDGVCEAKCDLADELKENEIDVYVVNLIKASNAKNAIKKDDSWDYLLCLANDDLNRVCVGDCSRGVNIQQFDWIIEECLLSTVCEIPTQSPTEWPTPEPTDWPTPEPTAWPTPEPTDWPTPEPTEWPTPEPTDWPTPEPTAWPTPEPTEWPTPEPTEWPTPEPTDWPTPEPTAWPTPEPTEWPTPEPTNSPIQDICPYEVRMGHSFDFVILLDNSCGLSRSDCEVYLEGVGEIISTLLDDTDATRVAVKEIISRGNANSLVDFDDSELQDDPVQFVRYVRRKGHCTAGGDGKTDTAKALQDAMRALDDDDDRIDKIIVVSACEDTRTNKYCKRAAVLEEKGIDVYAVNLIDASDAENVITKGAANTYLECVTDNDTDRVCAGEKGDGVSIEEFDDILECLLPQICEPPTPAPTEWPTPEPTMWPTPEPTNWPTPEPTEWPTPEPTEWPTPEPTEWPTPEPTDWPTPEPTQWPTPEPTEWPTPEPTQWPTPEPTEWPTPEPTEWPTPEPTEWPTPEPTMWPTPEPTEKDWWWGPCRSEEPTQEPTSEPTHRRKQCRHHRTHKNKKKKKKNKKKKRWPTAKPTEWPTPEPTDKKWKKHKKKQKWPTPEPTAWPTPEPTDKTWKKHKKKHKKWPTPKPTGWPTPEPTAWPTPEPTDKTWKKKKKKKKKKWRTPHPTTEPTTLPTSEPTESVNPNKTHTPEPTTVPTPEPTQVPTPKPVAVSTSGSTIACTDIYGENQEFDYVIFIDNSCNLDNDDCNAVLEGVSQIVSPLLNYPTSRVATLDYGEDKNDVHVIVGFDDNLQKNRSSYVEYVKKNGDCTDNGKDETDLYSALTKGVHILDEDDAYTNRKFVIVSACMDDNVQICKKWPDILREEDIEVHVVNLVNASSNADNALSSTEDAQEYLSCLSDYVCINEDITAFEDVISCLIPDVCRPHMDYVSMDDDHEYPTPEPTPRPSPSPTLEPVETPPTPEPTEWPTPEPIKRRWKNKKGKKWPTPKPTDKPTSKKWKKKKKKKKKKRTSKPTEWPTSEPTPEPTDKRRRKKRSYSGYEQITNREEEGHVCNHQQLDFVIFLDNSCKLADDDCDHMRQGTGEIIYRLLNHPDIRIATMLFGNTRSDVDVLVQYDDLELQRDASKYVDYIRKHGECTEGGSGDTNLYYAIKRAQQLLDYSRISKFIFISACRDMDKVCKVSKDLDRCDIDSYIVNLIAGSDIHDVSNVIETQHHAQEYLACLNPRKVCVGLEEDGVSISEFDGILDECLLPDICEAHSNDAIQ